MRTQNPQIIPAVPNVPLLDATFLPGDEDWAVLESLNLNGNAFDHDDDRFADFGVSAGDFD